MPGDDISNKTVTVLVVLTVVITVMSTLAVINAVNQLEKNPPTQVSSSNQGQVSLEIQQGTGQSTQISSVTGQVALGIEQAETEEKSDSDEQPMDVQLPE